MPDSTTAAEAAPLTAAEMTRRQFFKRAAWFAGGIFASTGSLAYVTEVEPRWMEIERVEMRLPRLSPAFDGMTIVQLSDIHVNAWMTAERLLHVVHEVNTLQPDVVVLTGDFVSRRAAGQEQILANALGTLKPRLDAFAVLGNHDHWSDPGYIRRALKKAGVQELVNSFHTIRRGGESLHICGLDDAWVEAADVERVLEQLPAGGDAILLAHEPDPADQYAQAQRFDLQLSGHSHGGQIRAPLFGPLHLPNLARKYHTAEYSIGRENPLKLYVNRGVGMVWPYVRFNCRPEITLFTLRSAKNS